MTPKKKEHVACHMLLLLRSSFVLPQLLTLNHRISFSPEAYEGITHSSGHGGEVEAGGNMVLHGLAGQLRHAHAYGGDHGDVVEGDAGHPGVISAALMADEFQHG